MAAIAQAEADLAALSILGVDVPPYVALSSLPVDHENVHKPWELVYDSACDGMCLEALYARAGQTGPRSKRAQIIICRDDVGHVAGAFLDEPVRNVINLCPKERCAIHVGDSGW